MILNLYERFQAIAQNDEENNEEHDDQDIDYA